MGLRVATVGFEITFRLTAGTQHGTVTAFLGLLHRGAAVANFDVFTTRPSLPQVELRRLAGTMAARMTRP
jgi:hypothetical protein